MKGYGTDQKNGSPACKHGCCGRAGWSDCLSIRHSVKRTRRILAKRARQSGRREVQAE